MIKINNKGFMKYETATIIVVLIIIFAFLLNIAISNAKKQQLSTMRDSANNFAKTVMGDSGAFNNSDYVYLDEAIDSGLFADGIKGPGGKCDTTETKFMVDDGIIKVSLRCGDYLIDNANASTIKNSSVYKVGSWSNTKKDGYEKKTLYNCSDNGKLLFDDYKEDMYLVHEVNKKYSTNHFYISDISECQVVSKVFYRSREKVA